jgi:acetoin utilization deacetylase AcuC-like enzyme
MLKIAHSALYHHPLPDGHRFPMEKYSLLPEQLLYEGTVKDDNFFVPTALLEEDILGIHEAEYWNKLKYLQLSPKEQRVTGFPLSEQLVSREIHIMHGTVKAAEYALKYGVSMNIAGGTHHAFTNKGEGFCLLNDLALGAHYLLKNNLKHRILIVDLDVHQGNGTAQIFKNEPCVFTFSMHGSNNYPLHKEKSDTDVPLPDGIDDAAYLKLLDFNLNRVLDAFEPDFIFYQSGVDVLASDQLGRLGLTENGCLLRDKFTLEIAYRNNIPLVAAMGGGYSKKISDIVNAHANTFRLAQEIWF